MVLHLQLVLHLRLISITFTVGITFTIGITFTGDTTSLCPSELDHVADYVRNGHSRQGNSAEDMMMMMLRCLKGETGVWLEEHIYPNSLLTKAMKEGKDEIGQDISRTISYLPLL